MPLKIVKGKSEFYKVSKDRENFFRGQMKPRVTVVGSLHMDLSVKVKSIPCIGETVLGKDFKMSPGGKGANQAVAAAKLGADVTMIGRVGADVFGEELIRNAKKNRIDIKHIVTDEEAFTGLALIMVDEEGNNIIAVASGADMRCCREDVDRALKVIKSSDALLTQLETPLPVVEYAVDKASEAGVKVILNPAPAQELSDELVRKVYALTPNEKEAQMLSGIEVRDLGSAKIVAEKIFKKGVKNVILTLGEKGAIIATRGRTAHIEGIKVNVVDTTGAGDAFCGALAVAVSSGKRLEEAVSYANCAGALATTKIGAQEALPTKLELEEFMRKRGLI